MTVWIVCWQGQPCGVYATESAALDSRPFNWEKVSGIWTHEDYTVEPYGVLS